MAREEKVVTVHTFYDALVAYEELIKEGYHLSTDNHLFPTAYIGVYVFGAVKGEDSITQGDDVIQDDSSSEEITDESVEQNVVESEDTPAPVKKPGRPARK